MKVLSERAESAPRLRELGLTEEILREAVTAGELERVSCTPLDPPSYPGTAAWALTFRRLCEQMLPLGWRREARNNLPLVIEPALRIAVAVTSGNANTGDPDRIPTTKYPKGPMTEAQVTQNQLVLFGDQPQFVPTPPEEERVTWLLLIQTEYRPRVDEAGEHIARCEISLPAEIDEDGWVTRWSERIMLEPVRLDDIPALYSPNDEEETEIEVPVTRRD